LPSLDELTDNLSSVSVDLIEALDNVDSDKMLAFLLSPETLVAGNAPVSILVALYLSTAEWTETDNTIVETECPIPWRIFRDRVDDDELYEIVDRARRRLVLKTVCLIAIWELDKPPSAAKVKFDELVLDYYHRMKHEPETPEERLLLEKLWDSRPNPGHWVWQHRLSCPYDGGEIATDRELHDEYRAHTLECPHCFQEWRIEMQSLREEDGWTLPVRDLLLVDLPSLFSCIIPSKEGATPSGIEEFNFVNEHDPEVLARVSQRELESVLLCSGKDTWVKH
jgi:hypothetical protein